MQQFSPVVFLLVLGIVTFGSAEDGKEPMPMCKYENGDWLPCTTCSSPLMTRNCYHICCMSVKVKPTTTSRSIYVEWSIPPVPPLTHERKIVSHYEVHLTSDQTMCVRRNVTYSKHIFWGDLTPAVTYNITVQVFSGDAKGARSEMLQVTTPVEAPSLPPQQVSAKAQSSHAIKVQWKPPPTEGLRGNITRYEVHWTSQSPKASYRKVTKKTSVVLSGLRSDTTYSISVQAHTDGMSGPASPAVEAKTWTIANQGIQEKDGDRTGRRESSLTAVLLFVVCTVLVACPVFLCMYKQQKKVANMRYDRSGYSVVYYL